MNSLRAFTATTAIAPIFAARMRQADRDEVLASDGMEPLAMLEASILKSEIASAVFVEDEPLAMFGVVPISYRDLAYAGQIWCLTTDAVDTYPVTFWRTSKAAIRLLLGRYGLLVQCIDARYEKALRWAARLGAEIGPTPHPCGTSQLPFFRAVFRAPR